MFQFHIAKCRDNSIAQITNTLQRLNISSSVYVRHLEQWLAQTNCSGNVPAHYYCLFSVLFSSSELPAQSHEMTLLLGDRDRQAKGEPCNASCWILPWRRWLSIRPQEQGHDA